MDKAGVNAVKDNDKLFSYALVKDPEISRAAAAAISDSRAVRMLVDLHLGRPDLMKVCALNPCRTRDDLWLIMQQLGPDDGKEVIARLTKQEELLRSSVEKDQYNSTCAYAISDEDILYGLMQQYPAYRFRHEIRGRFLMIARNKEHIIEILKKEDADSSTAIATISDADGLRDIALHALNSHTRSLAAKRLLKLGLDDGHVQVTHAVCPLCGGKVTSEVVCKGTIEAHSFYKCSQCGNSAHQTILGNDRDRVFGDYYRYAE